MAIQLLISVCSFIIQAKAIMNGEITLYLVIGLLAVQVTVLAALIVLWRKYHKLKQLFDSHQASWDLEKQRRPTDAKEDSKNSYIAGTRDSSTLVRTNSNESIVWVPTPTPQRRSKNIDEDLNVTELMVVIPKETNQGDIGFVNKNFASSPAEELVMEKSTADSSDTAGPNFSKSTTSLKVPSTGSQLHGITAATKKRKATSQIQKTTVETKPFIPTAHSQIPQVTAGPKVPGASSIKNTMTADTATADPKHHTATAVPSIHVQQPNEYYAGTNDGYYDNDDGIYENQEAVRTVSNNNNDVCRVESTDINNDTSEDRVIESHVTSALEQQVDEPIYVNRDIIKQFRR